MVLPGLYVFSQWKAGTNYQNSFKNNSVFLANCIVEWHFHSQTCHPDRDAVDCRVTVSLSDMPTQQWDRETGDCLVTLSLWDLPPVQWDSWLLNNSLTLRHATLTVRMLIVERQSQSQTCHSDSETVDCWVTLSLLVLSPWQWHSWMLIYTLTLGPATLTVRLLIVEWRSQSQTCRPDSETVDCWVTFLLSYLPPWQWDSWILSDTLILRPAMLAGRLFNIEWHSDSQTCNPESETFF